MMITRYSLDYENCNLEYDPDGDVVDYGDHCAVVFVLQSRLEELNQKVTALQQENASLEQDASDARKKAIEDCSELLSRQHTWISNVAAAMLALNIDTVMQSNNQ